MALAVPVLLVLLVAAGTVLALAIDLQVTSDEREAARMQPGVLIALVGAFVTAAAAVVLRVHPGHRVGVLLAVLGLVWHLDGIAESYAAYAFAHGTFGVDVAYWFFVRFGAVLLAFFIVVLALYPDGRLPVGRARLLGIASLVCAPGLPVALMLVPDRVLFEDTGISGVDTGFLAVAMSDAAAATLMRVGQGLTLLAFLAALVVLVVRHRGADEGRRRSLKWLSWAGIMCLLSIGLLVALGPGTLARIVLDATVVLAAASIAVGIARPGLVDIDALVASTLTLAVVAVAMVGLDLAVLGVARAQFGDRIEERDVQLLVLLLVLVLYGPLRTLVGNAVRRVLWGRRGDRYDVVSSFARSLETAGSVQEQVPALARAVASAFKVPWVRVEVVMAGGELLAAEHGRPEEQVRAVDMTYQGERIGRLVLPQRGLRALLSARDQDLLLDLVRQAALAVRARVLAEELQQSRERLVLAREDDRRRIRRDLHDGLGPALGGVALRLQAAGNAVEHDPGLARELVGQSRTDVQEALDDVRRLVHGLRPPALDDLGLEAAIEQQALRVREELDVEVDAQGTTGLPAAVEVAAYRIVSEALTNVLRHAQARRCTVSLHAVPVDAPQALEVVVTDDGRGIPDDVAAGVGLLSVRERAEELGGHAEVVCAPAGGTQVRAWMPFGRTGVPDPARPTAAAASSQE